MLLQGCRAAGRRRLCSRQPAWPLAPSHHPASGLHPRDPQPQPAQRHEAWTPGEAVAPCAPQGSEAGGGTPRTGWALQKESSPEVWQRPNPAQSSPGLEEDGSRTAQDITFAGFSRAHATAPRHRTGAAWAG